MIPSASNELYITNFPLFVSARLTQMFSKIKSKASALMTFSVHRRFQRSIYFNSIEGRLTRFAHISETSIA